MENGISGSSGDFWASSRKYRGMEEPESGHGEEDRFYTQKFDSRCPVDASKVVHTVQFGRPPALVWMIRWRIFTAAGTANA